MSTTSENQSSPNIEKQTLENDQKQANPGDHEDRLKNSNERIAQLEAEVKQKDDSLATLKAQIAELEKEVAESQKFKAQHSKETEEVAILKEKSENTLTRAKEIIFEKTKIVKNQELQIEALNQQIESLKDVVSITKDLLEIRNMECKQLETKIQCIENRVLAEKERYDLMHKKLEAMIRYNGDLKREYETQLCLFSALRERYNEKELARDVLDNSTLNGASTSTSEASSSTDTTQICNDHVDEKEGKEEKVEKEEGKEEKVEKEEEKEEKIE